MAPFTTIILSIASLVTAARSGMCPALLREQCPLPPALDAVLPGVVPLATREYWMRRAQQILNEPREAGPCPMYPFVSAIVNHTDTHNDPGDLICTGSNQVLETGNAILHGEIAAIMNCSEILQNPYGRFRLSPDETRAAFGSLTLYTNAESCPMCATSMRWAGIREYVYGTSIETLIAAGWGQISISSADIWKHSTALSGGGEAPIGPVLERETDPYFAWQFDALAPCPAGCSRRGDGLCK